MSHYIKVKTKYRDAAALVESLRAQFPNAKVEHLAQPERINGYMGKKRAACTIVVRANKEQADGRTAPFYGDLGYSLEADGSYAQHGDDSDEAAGIYAPIAQRYARTVAVKQAKLSGFTVSEVKAADGTITLNLSKWS